MYKPPAHTEIAELSKRMQEMKDNLRRMVEQASTVTLCRILRR